MSPRVVLTAYHCQEECKTGTAILGAHEIDLNNDNRYSIPIEDVRFPDDPHITGYPFYNHNHDFALVILSEPAKMSEKVGTICLPHPKSNYGGLYTVAVGWGRFAAPQISRSQSPMLRKVTLRVSRKVYKNTHFFGTELRKNDKDNWMDPCSGDSGKSHSNIYYV